MTESQRRGGKRPSGGKALTVLQAVRSFRGYLEGTGKAKHTIAAYQLDLQDFSRFLETQKSRKTETMIAEITRRDLERYHERLKLDGQKANTRRRKLMTLRKLMEYMNLRHKTPENVAKRFAAPDKVERVPATFVVADFLEKIRALPADTLLARRNRALFFLMAETGISVSEVSRLRWQEFDPRNRRLEILGKNERSIPLSAELAREMTEVRGQAEKNDPCFLGFNRYGSLGGAMTPRGIELLVKAYGERLGLETFTPRNFRHSAAVAWFRAGATPLEIQARLGLKTDYSMRVYAPIFASIREEIPLTTPV